MWTLLSYKVLLQAIQRSPTITFECSHVQNYYEQLTDIPK